MKLFLVVIIFSYGSTLFAQVCVEELKALKLEVMEAAGSERDVPLRLDQFKSIYQETHGLFEFPIVAAHGARWAYLNQRKTDLLVKSLLGFSTVWSGVYAGVKWASYKEFVQSLFATNRQVFVDTVAITRLVKKNYNDMNYLCECRDMYSSKSADLFEEYINQLSSVFLHIQNRTENKFSKAQKRELFRTALVFEQHSIVSKRVTEAFEKFNGHWRAGAKRAKNPSVKFAYFPKGKEMKFQDFSSRAERIKWAMESYDIAVSVGMDVVEDTLDL
jgi:hypothetical protein